MLGKMLRQWYKWTTLQRVWPIVQHVWPVTLHDWSYVQHVWPIAQCLASHAVHLTNHTVCLIWCAVQLVKWSTGSTIDQVRCAINQMLHNWPNAVQLVKLINSIVHLVKCADWPNASYNSNYKWTAILWHVLDRSSLAVPIHIMQYNSNPNLNRKN